MISLPLRFARRHRARGRTARCRTARCRTARWRTARWRTARWRTEDGALSLEFAMLMPVIALLAVGLITTVMVLRDVLLVHEAARVGARVAATTLDNGVVEAAARQAAPELDHLRVTVTPAQRDVGEVVTVTASTGRRLGPTVWQPRGRAHARVEPSVGAAADPHPWWRLPPTGPRPPGEAWQSGGERGEGTSDGPTPGGGP